MAGSRASRRSLWLLSLVVLWSSQGLKDGQSFSLGAINPGYLKLGEKFSVKYFTILILALFAVLAFRLYVFI